MIRSRDDREHQGEGDASDGDGKDPDRAVKHEEVDARSPQGRQLGVGRQSADPDEETQEKRDREREDDDVRERERDDEPSFADRLLALYEKLGELNQPSHGHESGVSEESDERGREDF
jgi:hypothetical protein